MDHPCPASSLECALLESFVPQREPAALPGQDLHSIPPLRDEHEEVSAEDVEALTLDDVAEPIKAFAHVYRLREEVDFGR